jgi:hypothetical protein
VTLLVVPVTAGFTGRAALGRAALGRAALVERSDATAQTQDPAEGAAAAGRPRLKVPDSYHLVPAGKQQGRDLLAQGPLGVEVHNLSEASKNGDDGPGRITADIDGLSGKVRFEGVDECKRAGDTRVVCPLFDDPPRPEFDLRALKAGRVGDSGSIRYTYTSPQGQVRTASTKLVIGHVQLGATRLPMRRGVERGDKVAVPVVFKNIGEVTARGVTVTISGKVEPSPAQRHRNCRYKAQESITTCSFPRARIRPGEARALKPAPSVRSAGSDMYEVFDYRAGPMNNSGLGGTSGGPDPRGGEYGRGSSIRLVEVPGEEGRFRTGQNGGLPLKLLAQRDTHIDYEAIGAHASAESGDTARFRVGLRNKGPGEFGIEGDTLTGTAEAKVTIPPGTTVLRAPREETDSDGVYRPLCKRHDRTYVCQISRAPGRGGSDTSLEFLVRIGESGRGRVELPDEPLPRRDPVPGNDTAAITLNSEPDYGGTALIALAAIAAAGTLGHRYLVMWRRPARADDGPVVSPRAGTS